MKAVLIALQVIFGSALLLPISFLLGVNIYDKKIDKTKKNKMSKTTSLGPPASAEHARSRIERQQREEDKKWIEDLIKEHSCKCGCKNKTI